MRMYNPPHPGEVLKELYLQPMGLSVTETAGALGVSRKTLSAILNGRARVTPEMALRLARALDGTAATWINLQAQRDLWDAEQAHPDLHVRPLMPHKNGGRAHRSAV